MSSVETQRDHAQDARPTHEARRADPVDRVWATTRIAIGLVFLWAFLDKTFALGFATGRAEDGTIDRFGDAAWINGGSPTEGYLSFATSGPLADFYQSFAGAAWADWLFMIGLLGIGIGLTFGLAMRISAISGAVMLMLMWSATLLPENHPFIDDHVVYALVLVGLWLAGADRVWGLGDWWRRAEVVQRVPLLR